MPDRAARFRSTMQITLCFDGSESTAKILDVSEQGMKLFFKAGLPVGAIVGLRAPGVSLLAEVRWTRRGHCGLQLLDPLSGDQMAQLTGAARARTSPFFTGPPRDDRYVARRPVDDSSDGSIRG